MADQKKKNGKVSKASSASDQGAQSKAGDQSKTAENAKANGKAKTVEKKGPTGKGRQVKGSQTPEPATGLNRIPQWLHQEKGLSDTVAGSLVVIVSGGLIMLLVFILTKVWPAS